MKYEPLQKGQSLRLIGGDFNITRFIGERRDPELHIARMSVLMILYQIYHSLNPLSLVENSLG